MKNKFKIILTVFFVLFLFSSSLYACIPPKYNFSYCTSMGRVGMMAMEDGPTYFFLGPLNFSLPFNIYISSGIVFGVPTLMIGSLLAWKVAFRNSSTGESYEN